MSNYGQLGEFRAEEEQFSSYMERVEAYFIANEIEKEMKQKSIFITSIGAKTYKLLRDLLLPSKPMDAKFNVITETLKKHFEPKPCEIVERFRFNTCDRSLNQSTADYVAELRRLSEFCNYGDKLEEHIRGRLVCGIRDNRIQRRLLSEGNLTLKKAVEISIGVELAEKNMVTLEKHQEKMPEIHVVKKENTDYQKTPYKEKCRICGRTGHDKKDCRFKNAKCFACGKVGHLKNVCKGGNQETNVVSREYDNEEDGENIYSMFNIETGNNGVIFSTIKLNDVKCKLQVDTGAAVSIISEQTLARLRRGKQKVELRKSKTKLKTFTGEMVDVLGKIEVDIGNNQRVGLFVVQGDVPNIAGRVLIKQL